MNLRYLLVAVIAFFLQDPTSEGKRWWSHIAFLADDALEGRNVGTAGFEKGARYVEEQFKSIGLKPGGVGTYRQPVKFESRVLVPEESKLALIRDGREELLTLGEEASLTARGELNGDFEAPMVFIGYGMSIPEANWDDLAGLDVTRQDCRVRQRPRASERVEQRAVAHELRRRAMGHAEEGWSVGDRDVPEPESAHGHDG